MSSLNTAYVMAFNDRMSCYSFGVLFALSYRSARWIVLPNLLTIRLTSAKIPLLSEQ